MRKGDDRPRESSKRPKKLALAPGEAPPPECILCGFVFTEAALRQGKRFYVRTDGSGSVCQDDKSCRARQLAVILGRELQGMAAVPEDGRALPIPTEWLFFKFPRDRVFISMDPRPKDWKAIGWPPRGTLEMRVLYCILYHSWCYPVSLPYAVQLSGTCPRPGRVDNTEDEILVDEYRRPKPLRVTDIGRILNEHQPHVSRAIARLVAAKEIRVDEDHVLYPCAKLAELSLDERRALADREIEGIDPQLRSVPKRFRKLLELIRDEAPEDISTGIFHEVTRICSAFNDRLKQIRTDRDSAIDSECSKAGILIPELEKLPDRRHGLPSPVVEEPTPQPSPPPEKGDDDETKLKELYAAGLGKGALGKLPSPRPKIEPTVWAETVEALRAYTVADDEAVQQLVEKCRERQDCTDAEVAVAVRIKGPLAITKRNAMGFLLTAVPNQMTGVGYQQIRQILSRVAADEERVRELERGRAEAFLAEPDCDSETAEWARGVLARIQTAGGED